MDETPELINNKAQSINFFGELVIANVGIRPFYESLEAVGAKVIQVDWSVPAGGDQDLINLLDKLVGEL
ncbi:MAG: fdrA domain protein [Anaerolineaceae bacterium]